MNILRVTGSMDPSMGGPPQGIRNSIGELERLGIRNEVVSCDAPDAVWLGRDSFPIHALGPGKYGFAYTPKLGPWLEENLSRFDAVIVHGLWLWPSICATRAVRALRGKRNKEMNFSHGLGKINADKSERLAADRTGGDASSRVTSARGNLPSEKSDLPESLNVAYGPSPAIRPTVQRSTLNSNQLRCFVMPHGMLDPWFQRDKSRRVKAVRNWFYWMLVERKVVNSADALLFTCQQELELARTTFGGYRPKREINVGYGIAEPPAFEPKMREAFADKCPGLNGRPYLLFMSRIHAKKNVAALVRAYARVRSEQNKGVLSHGLTRIDTDKSERPAADRTGGNADCRMTSTAGGLSEEARVERVAFPDLVIAGPGWESGYGEEVRRMIDEVNERWRAESGGLRPEVSETAEGGDPHAGGQAAAATKTGNCQRPTANSAPIHAVGMLSGAEKWGALYGCEAFVLPSHQENFGIAVVEALACGKPVLISDQVNIWREIVEDGAGLVGADTEEGVVKLLRRFFERWRGGPDGVVSPPQAERAEGGSASAIAAANDYGVTRGGVASEAPRACYLKRFAIGPAAGQLAAALKD